MLSLGIDVGKRHHEVALLDDAGALLWRDRIPASRAGFAALGEYLAGVDGATLTVGLEATGVYWLALHAWLTARGVARVVVLTPLQTKAFRNANLRGSKAAARPTASTRWRSPNWSGGWGRPDRRTCRPRTGRPRPAT